MLIPIWRHEQRVKREKAEKAKDGKMPPIRAGGNSVEDTYLPRDDKKYSVQSLLK